jgi:hypothetical protein
MVQAQTSIPSPADASDYSKRVVAYIYDNTPITRRDLGEYLLLRYGADNIDKFVGQYVIELAAAEAGKSVSAIEVEADIQEMRREYNLNQKAFAEIIVNRYGKNLQEWKEDVVKHRLLLTKLCSDRVNVTALRDMTDDSGGRTEIIRDARDLNPSTASIADELSKQYYLGYPSLGKKDGRWHSIRVEVRNRAYRVRARRGYIAS